jgi:hypothetical protein
LPIDFYFFKVTQPLTVSVKEKGGKPENHTPFHMISEIHTKTSSLKTLKLCPETYTKLYVNEFGFTRHTDKKENQIFLIYREIQSGAVAKSYIRKYFPIYEEAVSHLPYDFATAPL